MFFSVSSGTDKRSASVMSAREAIQKLENRRVKLIRPLIPPQILQEDLPLYGFVVIYYRVLTLCQNADCG